jgi:hypothetical protein
MIINIDYKFRDDIKADTVPIHLLTGPYNGVVYRYTQVSIKETKDDSAVMQFDYYLHETAEHTEASLRADPKFTTHIGLILNQLILDTVDVDDKEEIVEETGGK